MRPLGHFKNQISTIVTRQSIGTWLKPLVGTVQKSAVHPIAILMIGLAMKRRGQGHPPLLFGRVGPAAADQLRRDEVHQFLAFGVAQRRLVEKDIADFAVEC
jgi:hypothetical protein